MDKGKGEHPEQQQQQQEDAKVDNTVPILVQGPVAPAPVTMQSFADRIQPYLKFAYATVMKQTRAGFPVSIGFTNTCFPMWPLDAIAAVYELLHIEYLISGWTHCAGARTEHWLVLRVRKLKKRQAKKVPSTLAKLSGYPLQNSYGACGGGGGIKRWRVIAPCDWMDNEFLSFVANNYHLKWKQWANDLHMLRDTFFRHMALGNFKVLRRVVDLLEQSLNPFVGIHLLHDDVELQAIVEEHCFDFNNYFQKVLCQNVGLGYAYDAKLEPNRWGQADMKNTRIAISHTPDRYNDDKPIDQSKQAGEGFPQIYTDVELCTEVVKPLAQRIRALLLQVHERERDMVQKIVKILRLQYKESLDCREQLAQVGFMVEFPRDKSVKLYDQEGGDTANHTGMLCREWGLELTDVTGKGLSDVVTVKVRVCQPKKSDSWMSHSYPLTSCSSRNVDDYKEWRAVMAYKCRSVVEHILDIQEQSKKAAASSPSSPLGEGKD